MNEIIESSPSTIVRVDGPQNPTPAMLLQLAVQQGADLEKLERLMALQERYEANEARKAYNEALAGFKAEPLTVRKNKAVGYTTREGDFVGYKHAELSEVVDAVSPALSKHGFSFRWDVEQSKDWITVTCILRHAKGHSEQIKMGGPPDASGKKNAIQQIASTTSYLQRYTLKAITGVAEAGDDDDAGGADAGGEPARAPAQAPAPAKTATYPDTKFKQNLPAWREAIATGRKTADQIIATVETKGILSDEQKAAIRAPATKHASDGDSEILMTYAQVADKLTAAKTLDKLSEAATLISTVADEGQRGELSALYERRTAELNG